MFLIDVGSCSVLWQMSVPIIWPTVIEFDATEQQVLVRSEANDVYRYTYDGEFLDADVVARAELDSALTDDHGYQLFNRVQAILADDLPGDLSTDKAAEVTDLLRTALGKKMSPNTKASAHRIIGELAEAQGDLKAALSEYTAALELNPMIGLKRKVKALRSTCQ